MKVFVYGTLKQGYGNHRLLAGKKYLGKAVTDIKFDMIGCGFPVVFMCDNGLPLAGEVYQVDDTETLRNLDALEGEGAMYDRREVPITMASGDKHVVSMYIGNTRYWSHRIENPENDRWNNNGVLEWNR